MTQPSFEDLDPVLRAGSLRVAHRLAKAGEEAWLVGGAVRNLALGIPAADADLATGALPDRVLELFPRSLAVGKAFGTIIVHPGEERWEIDELESDPELSPEQTEELAALDIEVTTFRSEAGYSDGRRPDEVQFGASAEEDAERRDFTCNALFMEVLTGRLFDPTGGLEDLEARRLRCVGDPLGRFSEDGLRLLRLARFHARYNLDVETRTLEAARACRDTLFGVSAERRLQELKKLFTHEGSARGVVLLDEIELWPQVFSGCALVVKGSPERPLGELFAALSSPPGEAMGLAALMTGLIPGLSAEACEKAVLALHGPRAVAHEVSEIVRLASHLDELSSNGDDLDDRAEQIRLLREPKFEQSMQLVLALNPEVIHDFEAFERLGLLSAAHAVLEHKDAWPKPFLDGKDLLEAGIPRGPLFGEILKDLEDHQLRGELTSREAALRWVAELARTDEADHDGGNTRRSE